MLNSQTITIYESKNTVPLIDNTTGNPLPAPSNIKPGVYKHYKGKHYLVFFVCLNSETLQEMVVYQSLYGDFRIWSRPLEMFLGDVEHQENIQPRFKWVGKSKNIENYLTK